MMLRAPALASRKAGGYFGAYFVISRGRPYTLMRSEPSHLYRLGSPTPRFEDARFLKGAGRYVSDIKLPGMAHARLLRSPHAAGEILHLDLSAAKGAPGVLAVLCADDATEDGLGAFQPFIRRARRDGSENFVPPYGVLAQSAVRHVGDAIALVVAETEAEAEAALELIELEIEPAPAVTNVAAATKNGAPPVWQEEPSNTCFVERLGDAAKAEAAFSRAAHVVEEEYVLSRVAASPMETRSAIGVFDAETERYTLYAGLQTPPLMRDEIANSVLRIPPEQLRIVSPDVGGGFGLKASAQRELALVLWAAKRLGRPVRWVSQRAEAFVSDHHARDSVSRVALALDEAGRFLALRVRTTANLGAYIDSFGLHITVTNLGGLSGPYMIGAYDVEVVGAFSHTQPIAPYRGAGRPEASYCIERIVEAAARQLGMSAVEMRRQNMVPPSAMPYETGLAFRYDCGEFERVMDMALAFADVAGAAARARDAEKRGHLHGVGMAYAVEIAGGPQDTPLGETAALRFDATGDVTLALGTHNHGQGHETAFRQLVHEVLGLTPERVKFVNGDTDAVARGIGTFGSRSIGAGGAALIQVAATIIEQASPYAADILEAAAGDITFEEGHFVVRGTDRKVSLHDVGRVAGESLSAEAFVAPENSSYPNGCHVCEVEIERDTGRVALTRYALVDDVGRVLNPLLLGGQLHGGVAQGAGQILCENIAFEPESGQLLSGSFMDYCLPRADDLPMINTGSHEVPSANTPFGIKGAGEAGAVGGLAAVMNGVMDALSKAGVTQFDMPATPERIWRALRATETNERERTN